MREISLLRFGAGRFWGAAEVVRLKQVTALGKKVWRLGACFWPT